jgi:hypothetical protein
MDMERNNIKLLNKKWVQWFVGFCDAEGNFRRRFFSSAVGINKTKNRMDPHFVTGFCDAESTFVLSIYENNKLKTGWVIKPVFSITLHYKDLDLLIKIKSFFGEVGSISTNKNGNYPRATYYIGSVKDFNEVIIPHFSNYPLISKKRADYELLKQAVELINLKENKKKESLIKFVNIRASMNNGLSPILKENFIKVVPVERPHVETVYNLNPNWLAGFFDGEACFYVNITKSKTKVGYAVNLTFTLDQHSRDKSLIEYIIKYLNCGNLITIPGAPYIRFSVSKFSHIIDVIIPFLNKYSLMGSKKLDFNDFNLIANLMKQKSHLTTKGLSQIQKIKAGMNKGRM